MRPRQTLRTTRINRNKAINPMICTSRICGSVVLPNIQATHGADSRPLVAARPGARTRSIMNPLSCGWSISSSVGRRTRRVSRTAFQRWGTMYFRSRTRACRLLMQLGQLFSSLPRIRPQVGQVFCSRTSVRSCSLPSAQSASTRRSLENRRASALVPRKTSRSSGPTSAQRICVPTRLSTRNVRASANRRSSWISAARRSARRPAAARHWPPASGVGTVRRRRDSVGG